MILSLEIFTEDKLDIFSFFPVENAISIPFDLWFSAICSSLKMKHSVLILELPQNRPDFDSTRRFLTSEKWCWLAPRGFSLVLDHFPTTNPSFSDLKSFLSASK